MKKTNTAGLPEGWVRATFIIKEQTHNRIKEIAHWDRKTLKEVINTALDRYLQTVDQHNSNKEHSNV